MLDIIETVDLWLSQRQSVALATVVQTWGSAPRQVGAKLAVSEAMAIIGSVSGGCVEGAVIEQCLALLPDRQPRLLDFGVSDDEAWEVGLACGGSISIYVEPLDQVWWSSLCAAIRSHKPAASVTVLQGDQAGKKLLLDDAANLLYAAGGLASDQIAILTRAATDALANGKSGRQQIGNLNLLIEVQRPQPHLILIGAVHTAMPLHHFAHQLGFRVTIIDPRTAFATAERFPDAEAILHHYPDKALPSLGLDTNTYVAVLTHDPKIDDPALEVALASPSPYIGVLSSRRTHEARVKRLIQRGIDPRLFDRIRTPIGLKIGAQTPEEIALCILAEIIAVRNGASV